MREMSEAEIAWLAGIFDGEGCLSFSANDNTWTLAVAMTDFDVIERLHAVTGAGYVYDKDQNSPTRKKPIKAWRVYLRADIEALVAAMHPWLSARRRAKIAEFREWHATAGPGRIKGRAKIAGTCWKGHKKRPGERRCHECRGFSGPKVKGTACTKGHEFTPENTYIDPKGNRFCRECGRARRRAKYAANPKAANAARAARKAKARAR